MTNSLIGKQLANFRLEHLLGRGGMAEVYFGRDLSLQRSVAIKVMDVRFRDDSAYAERFISEARAVATWRHENIIQVYYAGQQDDLYYFVMEYIDGSDLATLLKQYTSAHELIPHSDVIRIGRAVASALDYAHAKGVIHRDVKPANVMIASDGRVVLTDFGLALHVQHGSIGEVFGTPHYVAPEQARNSADARPQSDIYSLGVMMYEMLTGSVPFDDPSPTAVALMHLTTPPPSPRALNPALNEATEAVLLKALEKDPAARYPTATALVDALSTALRQADTSPITAPSTVHSISQRTISEHIAQMIRQTRTAPAPDQPRIPSTAKADSPPPTSTLRRPVLLGGALVGGVAALGLLMLFIGRAQQTDSAAVLLATTSAPTEIPVIPTATDVSPAAIVILPTDTPFSELTTADIDTPSPTPTNTPSPTPTDTPSPTPTDTPSPTPTDTPSPTPTDTPSPTPTDTPSPTPTDTPSPTPTDTPIPLPTVLYPDGQRVALVWNDTSFYWHNPTSRAIRVAPMDFEPLDAEGRPAGRVFNGQRWTLNNIVVEPNSCVAVELLRGTGFLRPSQCQRLNAAAVVQPNSRDIFWVERDGAIQFRVLWQGEEVGRCLMSARSCEVFIP